MKKTFVTIALLLAALATAGQLSHPQSPLTFSGQRLSIIPAEAPFPICPPHCDRQ